MLIMNYQMHTSVLPFMNYFKFLQCISCIAKISLIAQVILKKDTCIYILRNKFKIKIQTKRETYRVIALL